MKSVLIIARREFAAKRFVLLAAVIFGLFPPLLSLMPLRVLGDRTQFIAAAGTFSLLMVTVIVAVMLGASMIGGDLSEGRMSFYFARPVSGAAIWFGKLGAAVVIVAGTMAILLVGPMSVSRTWLSTALPMPGAVVRVLILAVLILLIAHILSTAIRSRSPFALVDFLMFVLAAAAIYAILRPIRAALAVRLNFAIVATITLLGIASMIAAGAWQLSRGRVDIRRSHWELSRFLWPSIGLILIVAGAYVVWVVSAKPEDLNRGMSVEPAGDDRWVTLTGASKGREDYYPSFFYNVDNGRFIRLGALNGALQQAKQRGDVAVWTKPVPGTDRREICFRHLSRGYTESSLGLIWKDDGLALSNDGRRLAVASNQTLTVYDLQQGRTIAAARIGEYPPLDSEVAFLSPDTVAVRVSGSQPRKGVSVEFDLVTRKVRPMPASLRDRADLRARFGHITFAELLSDKSVVLMCVDKERQRALVLLDADGTSQSRIPLGTAPFAWFVKELPSKNIVVACASQQSWNTYLVDLQSGRIVRTAENFRPLLTHTGLPIDDRFTPETGGVVGFDNRGALIRWDPVTGVRRTLFHVVARERPEWAL